MQTIGHRDIKAKLSHLLQRGHFPQTSLFYGVSGIGKKRVALDLMGNLREPDVFIVEPTPTTKQGPVAAAAESKENWTIKIEQIRDLKEKLKFHPLVGDYQIVIIDDAHQLTVSAANSLLKILEEPKGSLLFILITNSLYKILPTVRSRAAKYHFPKLLPQEVSEVISKLNPELKFSADDFEFFYRTFQGSVEGILAAIEAKITRERLRSLTSGEENFMAISARVQEILNMGIELKLFLQLLRQDKLDRTAENTGELGFFERITYAENCLARHIQKDFVLENLFMHGP